MPILILFIVIGVIIAFVVMYPFVGIPAVVLLATIAIIKRKSIKAWYDNLPVQNKQEKKNDSTDSYQTNILVNEWKNPFGNWSVEQLSKSGQEDRYKRSIFDNMRILEINEESGVALIVGTQGVVYDTTLNSCTCPDFKQRRLPCKHIYLLVRNYKKTSDNSYTNENHEKDTDNNYSSKTNNNFSGYDPVALDFEEEHEKDIERWRNKIEKMEDSAYDKENSDEVVSTLRKAVSLCDDFREFCSLYIGGTSYYDAYEAADKERIERDIEDYLENEYEDAKAEYEDFQQTKKEYSALKRKILKAISSSENGMVHKDIFALTTPENKNLAERALKELVNNESISKEKRGNKWVYFV